MTKPAEPITNSEYTGDATPGEAEPLAAVSCADGTTPPPPLVPMGGGVESDGLATAAPQMVLAASLQLARYFQDLVSRTLQWLLACWRCLWPAKAAWLG